MRLRLFTFLLLINLFPMFAASGSNVVHKVMPVLADRKYNSIPVRLTIYRYGRVKHIHVISAFPDHAKIITDALLQWEFKPYKNKNGELAEVETGIMFGTPKIGPPTARRIREVAAKR